MSQTQLRNLYTLPKILRVIKIKEDEEETRNAWATKFCAENLKRRHNLGDIDIDDRIILKMHLRKIGMRVWTEFYLLRIWQ